MFDFKAYLSKLDEALRANNATEHTHRPAPKQLLEGIKDLRATNEPSRIECWRRILLSQNPHIRLDT